MSDFALRVDALNGIGSQLSNASQLLVQCSSRINRQVDRLLLQSGFGVQQIRRNLTSVSGDVRRLSNDVDLTLRFVGTLGDTTIRHEDMAFRELSGTPVKGLLKPPFQIGDIRMPPIVGPGGSIATWIDYWRRRGWNGVFNIGSNVVIPFLAGLNVKMPWASTTWYKGLKGGKFLSALSKGKFLKSLSPIGALSQAGGIWVRTGKAKPALQFLKGRPLAIKRSVGSLVKVGNGVVKVAPKLLKWIKPVARVGSGITKAVSTKGAGSAIKGVTAFVKGSGSAVKVGTGVAKGATAAKSVGAGAAIAKGAKFGAIGGPKGVVVGVAAAGVVVGARALWRRIRR